LHPRRNSPGRILLHRETHCGPLNGINPSLCPSFRRLSCLRPLKRTRLGRMKMGTLQRSIKSMLLLWCCGVRFSFGAIIGYVEGSGNRSCQPQRRGFYRLGHLNPAQEEIVVVWKGITQQSSARPDCARSRHGGNRTARNRAGAELRAGTGNAVRRVFDCWSFQPICPVSRWRVANW
jgi:hypothetical protein